MSRIHWQFPLPRPYTGILLGNASLGIMVWGSDTLSLTISKTGFWEHRDGGQFFSQINYHQLRKLLETRNHAELTAANFKTEKKIPYRAPTQLPGGRLNLSFKGGAKPHLASLETDRGRLELFLDNGARLTLQICMERDLAWMHLGESELEKVELLPAWNWIGPILAQGGVVAPEEWRDRMGGGFRQTLPADDSLTIAWHIQDHSLCLAAGLGSRGDQWVRQALQQVEIVKEEHLSKSWWSQYTTTLPSLSIPDASLQRAWDYGVYKMAGMHQPSGLPATLQGPWMAEDSLPPWSNDYHFNINLQMIYWPVLSANRLAHLDPLWKMIRRWMPQLKENAEQFYRKAGALKLPHAVDDRCQVIGNYWQGTIDQAATAWMAQLAWLHYRYSMDTTILREIAWPLLCGAFEGFWQMTEETEEMGVRGLRLPVSVSAEFGSWGTNASFQLAAFHLMAQILPQAAAVLGFPADSRWRRLASELPPYTVMPTPAAKSEGENARIALWQGQDLTQSHRHHSHLAAIYPFCTISPLLEEHREIVKRSMEHWVTLGAGNWTGWSLPWAAALWARCDQASAAITLLRIWEEVFTNSGGQTLHNADTPGYSNWIHGPFLEKSMTERQWDQMQMDAGFGALQAIMEILVQQRGETLHILPSLPKQWSDFQFDGILTEGAFLVGATVSARKIRQIRIHSKCGGTIRLAGYKPMEMAPGQSMQIDVGNHC